MSSIAITKPTGPRIYRTRVETMLTDRRREVVADFMRRHIRSKRQRELFHLAMLSRLGGPRPGDAAIKFAIAWSAIDIGVDRKRIEKAGLIPRDSKTHNKLRKDCEGDEE